MRAASTRFNPYADHRIAARATILPSGVTVPITDGSVHIDPNALVRSTGEFTVTDDGTLDLVPTDSSDVLAPFGNEVRVERGIDYGDSQELITLATLGIENSSVSDAAGELSIRVSGLDRAQRISDAKFEAAYEIADTTNVIDAIEGVLVDAEPSIVTDFPVANFTVPKLYALEGDDPWDFAQKLAKAYGAELYFDADGVCVLRPIPSGDTAVAQLDEAENLLSLSIDWTRQDAFNRVIATGENVGATGDIPRYVATDEDPNSPTRYGGPFGRRPMFFASEMISDADMAEAAAFGQLHKNMGISERIGFESLVDPRLEAGDVVAVTRARLDLAQEAHIIDELTIPLGSEGGMSGSTRLTRVLT